MAKKIILPEEKPKVYKAQYDIDKIVIMISDYFDDLGREARLSEVSKEVGLPSSKTIVKRFGQYGYLLEAVREYRKRRGLPTLPTIKDVQYGRIAPKN